jgi:hypothetical protein
VKVIVYQIVVAIVANEVAAPVLGNILPDYELRLADGANGVEHPGLGNFGRLGHTWRPGINYLQHVLVRPDGILAAELLHVHPAEVSEKSWISSGGSLPTVCLDTRFISGPRALTT